MATTEVVPDQKMDNLSVDARALLTCIEYHATKIREDIEDHATAARQNASRIIHHLWIIFVLLPFVLGIVLGIVLAVVK